MAACVVVQLQDWGRVGVQDLHDDGGQLKDLDHLLWYWAHITNYESHNYHTFVSGLASLDFEVYTAVLYKAVSCRLGRSVDLPQY